MRCQNVVEQVMKKVKGCDRSETGCGYDLVLEGDIHVPHAAIVTDHHGKTKGNEVRRAEQVIERISFLPDSGSSYYSREINGEEMQHNP